MQVEVRSRIFFAFESSTHSVVLLILFVPLLLFICVHIVARYFCTIYSLVGKIWESIPHAYNIRTVKQAPLLLGAPRGMDGFGRVVEQLVGQYGFKV